MVAGSATHDSIEPNLINKRDEGELLPLEQVKAYAADSLNERWDKGISFSDDEFIADAFGVIRSLYSPQGKTIKGKATDMAVDLAEEHYKVLAPVIQPTHVEWKFTLELEKAGYPFDFMGYMDVVEANGVRDTKTSAKKKNQGDADNSLQLTLYDMAFNTYEGRAPKVLTLDNLVKTKSGKIATHVLETVRGKADHKRLMLRAEAIWDATEKGVFLPADESSWACSKKFCGYWNMCPYGERGRTR